MSKYRIKMNGKIYEMEIELVDEKVEARSSGGQNIPDVAYKKGRATDSFVRIICPDADKQTINNGNQVLSPMPGSIIKIMAGVGDSVAAGEPVLVLEAMKMENEICAQKNGKIKEMFVTVGQTVSGNATLFEIEPED